MVGQAHGPSRPRHGELKGPAMFVSLRARSASCPRHLGASTSSTACCLAQVIMQHLLRQGHFGVAEKFAESSGVEVDEESKAREPLRAW